MVKLDFKNRRWYEWIYIVLGGLGLLLVVLSLIVPRVPFSWGPLIGSALFLWFGTVPRKPE
jgi:hypothetical protein